MIDTSRIEAHYETRTDDASRYAPLKTSTIFAVHERRKAIARALRSSSEPISAMRFLDVGCGEGGFLLELLWLGGDPANMVGNELLEKRANLARLRLPSSASILHGDLTTLTLPEESFDLVTVFMVLMTIPDKNDRASLLRFAWELVKPGGLLLINEPVISHPRNSSVARVTKHEVSLVLNQQPERSTWLYPPPPFQAWASRSQLVYELTNVLFFPLRTHRLWEFRKPAVDEAA